MNTYIWASEFTEARLELLPKLRAHGFDGVEVPIFRPSVFPAAALRARLQGEGLACTAVSALVRGQSLVTEDAQVRQRTLDHLRAMVAAAAEAGATILAGPFYNPVGEMTGRRRTGDEWSRLVDALRELGPALDAHGITLAIEPLNRFETYVLNTQAEAATLCREVGHPRVGVLFDTFHATIEEKDLGASLRGLGETLAHVHISENDRGIPGSGHVPWQAVFDALTEMRYDGWLTIESFGFALGDLSAAASIWRDIEASPELIAWEGIRFLRQHWPAR
ncbi:MAG TPA: sugar phosphate isomerase/epimerase family protein [Vicinamibacterales bacterium]